MSGRKKDPRLRLKRYCDELGEGTLRTDGERIYCDACDGNLNCEQKSQVVQHVETAVHINAVQRWKAAESRQRRLILTGRVA